MLQSTVQCGGGILRVGPDEEILGFVEPQDGARGEGVGIEQGQEPPGVLRENQLPVLQAGADGFEGGTGLARARLSAYEYQRRLTSGGCLDQLVAQLLVVVAFDVIREYEGAVVSRSRRAMDRGVDAELLRRPRRDRPRTIDPGNILLLGKMLVELPDALGRDPTACCLDRCEASWA
ncbi:hypothetical protein OG581_02655 [Streptomyces sp. NBC_01386]|uniref:hypothetical protein n=1 Tax=Streptomyces sp. NBC_01386 TaxID=2903848 RepID=UPI003251A2A3